MTGCPRRSRAPPGSAGSCCSALALPAEPAAARAGDLQVVPPRSLGMGGRCAGRPRAAAPSCSTRRACRWPAATWSRARITSSAASRAPRPRLGRRLHLRLQHRPAASTTPTRPPSPRRRAVQRPPRGGGGALLPVRRLGHHRRDRALPARWRGRGTGSGRQPERKTSGFTFDVGLTVRAGPELHAGAGRLRPARYGGRAGAQGVRRRHRGDPDRRAGDRRRRRARLPRPPRRRGARALSVFGGARVHAVSRRFAFRAGRRSRRRAGERTFGTAGAVGAVRRWARSTSARPHRPSGQRQGHLLRAGRPALRADAVSRRCAP